MATAEDIARNWAEQNPKGPNKAGHFWRRDRAAGHWGTATARLVEAPGGKLVALSFGAGGTGTAMFTNLCDGYARKAGYPVFRVRDNSAKPDHAVNLAYFEKQAVACEAKIANARTVDWQAEADAIRATAKRYAAAFGI